MDALKFLREVQRMHNYYTSIYHDCLKCPMADMPCRIPVTDWGGSVLNTCVERVEQWSKEHPPRTRLQDFMENIRMHRYVKVDCRALAAKVWGIARAMIL